MPDLWAANGKCRGHKQTAEVRLSLACSDKHMLVRGAETEGPHVAATIWATSAHVPTHIARAADSLPSQHLPVACNRPTTGKRGDGDHTQHMKQGSALLTLDPLPVGFNCST